MLADINRSIIQNLELYGFKRSKMLSFGSIITLIDTCSQYANKISNNLILSELFQSADKKFIRRLIRINHNVRNAEIGHPGALQDDSYYNSLLDRLKIDVEFFQKKFDMLHKFRFIVSESAEVISNCNSLLHNTRVLMGHAQPFLCSDIPLEGEVCCRLVYVLSPRNQAVLLHPLARYEYCPDCAKKAIIPVTWYR